MNAGDFRGKQFWLRFLQKCFFQKFMSRLFEVFPPELIFKFGMEKFEMGGFEKPFISR